MTLPRLLALTCAAAVAAATPALAQHGDHGKPGDQHDIHTPKPGAAAAAGIAQGTVKNGVRVFDMTVTEEGFVPAKVLVKKGEKTRFVVTRKVERTCATEIVMKEHGINQPLPLDKAVTVEFTPKKSGELKYACAMGHIGGVVFIP